MRQIMIIDISRQKRQRAMAAGYAIITFAALVMLALDVAGR